MLGPDDAEDLPRTISLAQLPSLHAIVAAELVVDVKLLVEQHPGQVPSWVISMLRALTLIFVPLFFVLVRRVFGPRPAAAPAKPAEPPVNLLSIESQ